jgi:hypothetical protein
MQQLTTRGIANKGFSDMRRVVARFSFWCTLIDDSPAIPYWPYRQTLLRLEVV